MIKWYKPSEKIPELHRNIIIIYTVNKRFEVMRVGIDRENIDKINKDNWCDYWAYASDFNFPSEVKDE